MRLDYFRLERKRDNLEDLLPKNQSEEIKHKLEMLCKSEREYCEARGWREVHYFLVPFGLAVMGAISIFGLVDQHLSLTMGGLISSAIIYFSFRNDMKKYKKETGLGKYTTHSQLIEKKLAEYEGQLDNLIEELSKQKKNSTQSVELGK